MGQECNRLPYSYYIHKNKTTIFMPMLCSKPSIKDVQISHERYFSSNSNSNSTVSADPLSPKISCIGQVKRRNKAISAAAATNRAHIRNTSRDVVVGAAKHSKLRKFFSSKNLLTAAGARERGHSAAAAGKGNGGGGSGSGLISFVDLDPPLPVVKRASGALREEAAAESLWKRRSGGAALKGLQIHRLHHPRHHLQPTTV